jgi:hypothetical protein
MMTGAMLFSMRRAFAALSVLLMATALKSKDPRPEDRGLKIK